jgi:hypothetical protein
MRELTQKGVLLVVALIHIAAASSQRGKVMGNGPKKKYEKHKKK